MRIIESSFKKLYQEYLLSKLSVRDFCANQDFAVSTFYRWKKTLEESKTPPIDFVPIALSNKSLCNNSGQSQGLVKDCTPIVDNNILTITFTNGTKVEIKGVTDTALIKDIIHLF